MTKLKIALVAVGALVLLYLIPYLIASYSHSKARVYIGGKEFILDIADTNTERTKGLSGTEQIEETGGMLFVFPRIGNHGFWMKDMSYDIDIIWTDENYRITHIEKYISPDTYPKVFFPPKPSLYVFEILAGQADKLKIKTGDNIIFSQK